MVSHADDLEQALAAMPGFKLRAGLQTDSEYVELAYLASAIASRTLQVRMDEAAASSYFDGSTVFLAPSVAENQRPLVVAAHAALEAAGSLKPDMIRGINLRPSVARRYMALELPRALSACESLLPYRLVADFPRLDNPSDSPERSLVLARDRRSEVDLLPEWLGVLRPRLMIKNAGSSVSQSENGGQLKSVSIKEMPEHDEDEDLDESGANVLKAFANPLSKGNWFGDLLQDIMELGRGGQSEQDEDSGGGLHAEGAAYQAGNDAAITDNALSVDALPETIELLPVVADWTYPEWNENTQAYRNDWVSVNEIDAPMDSEGALEPCDLPSHLLARQLFQVGAEFENHRRQRQGSDIDVDALVEHLVDRAAGHSDHENVYINSQRTRRDLSAMMLVDISRSTADKIGEGKTIFGQQLHAAWMICDTLARFGDRVAVYGFHSWGRALTRMIRIKRFDEPESSVIEQRMRALEPSGLTRLGAAIRHASHCIQQEKYNTHRLLMVFSDGFAYDDEYEGRYAEADAAKALEEARQQGVACVCISIGTEKDDEALARVFGSSTYLRCNHLSELPGRLKLLVNSALKKVERSSKNSSATLTS